MFKKGFYTEDIVVISGPRDGSRRRTGGREESFTYQTALRENGETITLEIPAMQEHLEPGEGYRVKYFGKKRMVRSNAGREFESVYGNLLKAEPVAEIEVKEVVIEDAPVVTLPSLSQAVQATNSEAFA